MNTKEEFYTFVKKDGWGFDIIEADADGLWQWIEEYGKQARIDEVRKCLNEIELTYLSRRYFQDRIKELSK